MVNAGVMTISSQAIPRRRNDLRYEFSPLTGAITIEQTVVIREDAPERDYVSQLWAEDWNSPEDAIYDE